MTKPTKPHHPPNCACCARPTTRQDDRAYYAYCDFCLSGQCPTQALTHPWTAPETPRRKP